MHDSTDQIEVKTNKDEPFILLYKDCYFYLIVTAMK